MAVVETTKHGNATIVIRDDFYAKCSPEEIARRKQKLNRFLSELLADEIQILENQDIYKGDGGCGDDVQMQDM